MSGFPKGWTTTKFTEVLDISGGTQPPKSEFISAPQDGYIRLLQIRDFGEKPVPTFIPDNGKRKTCRKGDVLIGRYGASIGRICTGMEGAYNVALAKVIKPDFIDAGFLKYYLMSENFQQPLRLLSRSAQNGFNKKDLSNFDFVYPSLEVQKRIADKLDSVLAKVEAAQARLDKIPAILKRFRQSVLAAATSGELTKEWREQSEYSVERLENDLLGKIRNNKAQTLACRPFSLGEIQKQIPAEWKWIRLAGLADIVSGVAKGSKTKGKTISVPYLRVANVQRGYIDLDEVKQIEVSEAKASQLYLQNGDILFNEGGDLDKLGRGWIWEGQIDSCIHQNHVFRARVLSRYINPKYISYFGNESAREYFLREGTQTVNLANLNKTTLSLLPVPVPSYEEQNEIVNRVDTLLEREAAILKQYNAAEARLKKLSQSILSKAFQGELLSTSVDEDIQAIENSVEAIHA